MPFGMWGGVGDSHHVDKAVLQTRSDHVLILGDFNYSQINYEKETVTSNATDSSSLFFNKTQELCLFQHVTAATRIRQHQMPSTLDYVFTDDENVIEFITYETPLAKSDHVVLRWNLLLAVRDIKNTQVKYNYQYLPQRQLHRYAGQFTVSELG